MKILIYSIIILLILNIIYKYNKQYISETFNYNKICCIYAYYEKDNMYKKNLKYFIRNGILNNIDYYFVINGTHTITINKANNITILYRENKGLDFGAYSYVLHKLTKKYDYYIFLNTSVRGPFLRNSVKPWFNYFLELFTDNVKIVGTTINIFPHSHYMNYDLEKMYMKSAPFPHVQSMFFIITAEYLEYLMSINFFNEEELANVDINYVIVTKEIGLSQYALKNGWNINCILPKYKNLDYLTIKDEINPSSYNGDPYYTNCYFNTTINKYEVIFFKINRFLS